MGCQLRAAPFDLQKGRAEDNKIFILETIKPNKDEKKIHMSTN